MLHHGEFLQSSPHWEWGDDDYVAVGHDNNLEQAEVMCCSQRKTEYYCMTFFIDRAVNEYSKFNYINREEKHIWMC